MKRNIIILIVLFLFIPVNAQINNISLLPVSAGNDTLTEAAPLVLSDNKVMIFYTNPSLDSIFVMKSTDGGGSWSAPELVRVVNLLQSQERLYLTTLRSSPGRIYLAWSVIGEGMYVMYSDNEGTDWNAPQVITGGGIPSWQKRNASMNLTQLDDGRIILSFNVNNERVLFYREYSEADDSWGDAVEVKRATYRISDLSIMNDAGGNLMAIFNSAADNLNGGIYKMISTDNGITWSEAAEIVDSPQNEFRPKIVKRADGSLLLVYQKEEETPISEFTQNDIYYMISTDMGTTWQQETRFTKYIGDDNYINISHCNGRTFISFTTFHFGNYSRISYAVIEETVESFTPPFVVNANLIKAPGKRVTSVIIAKVIDDEAVASVEVFIPEHQTGITLYDDGQHNDYDANDNIWGNEVNQKSLEIIKEFMININKISLPIDNKGSLAYLIANENVPLIVTANDLEQNTATANESGVYNLEPSGVFEEGDFLFGGGFYLSGYSNSELWTNGVAPSVLIQDYLPGLFNPNSNDDLIYVVYKDDPPFGSSWLKWKDAVALGAKFYDGDNDGIYNPVDKNRNGTWDPDEDMPPLIGDVIAWCVYNDGLPDSLRRWGGQAQGIEIRQTVFASDLPELENVLFIKYEILNTGLVTEEMNSVYFGVWEDAELGDYDDNLVGCDTLLNSGFYYNYLNDDIYGDNPPAFFTSLLQGPVTVTNNPSDTAIINNGALLGTEVISGSKNLDISSHVFYGPGNPAVNDPANIEGARYSLLGKNQFGELPDPCGFYGEVRGGINCSEVDPHFWFSGDPVTDAGWILTDPNFYKNLISTGPFKLEAGKPQEIIIAYVLGRGMDPINSITVARENVRRAIAEYQNNFATMTYTSPPPTNPVTDYVLYQNYPNPFNPSTTIRYEIPQDGVVTIKVYDILGQEVATILNEFKKADRYEVKFNARRLASGVYIYRIKVNDFIESKKMIVLK